VESNSTKRAKELIGWHTCNNTLVALSRGKINGVIRLLPHKKCRTRVISYLL